MRPIPSHPHQTTDHTMQDTNTYELHRLPSSASSTFSTKRFLGNPFRSRNSTSTSLAPSTTSRYPPSDTASTTASLLSHSSTSTLKNPFSASKPHTISATPSFTPTSTLQIQAPGHSMWAFPLPPKSLETPIFTLDAAGRCDRPRYLSIRPVRSKGDCELVRADDEAGTSIAGTRYRPGPLLDPVVWLSNTGGVAAEGGNSGASETPGKASFTMRHKHFSRTTAFEYRGRRYAWRYGDKAERRRVEGERGEACNCLLVLEELRGEGKMVERRVVARLVRGEETRTAGTKASHAGNGGRLEMRLGEGEWGVADGLGEDGEIEEEVVVATVLVMLKKEIDRMRGWQIAMIGTFLSLLSLRYNLLLSYFPGFLPFLVSLAFRYFKVVLFALGSCEGCSGFLERYWLNAFSSTANSKGTVLPAYAICWAMGKDVNI